MANVLSKLKDGLIPGSSVFVGPPLPATDIKIPGRAVVTVHGSVSSVVEDGLDRVLAIPGLLGERVV